MINISGFLIIMVGFFAPFLSNGKLPSIFFFGIGFYLLLSPTKRFKEASFSLRWARMGLLLNIGGMLVLFLLYNLVITVALFNTYLVFFLLELLGWVINPITAVLEWFYPSKHIVTAGGNVQSTISFLRATLTSFSDIGLYIFIGILLGRKKRKRVKP